jgi:hypothetical protein
MLIKNEHGVAIYYEKAFAMMDHTIRESVLEMVDPCSECSESMIFCEYCKRHRRQFHEEFGPNMPDPEC